MPEKTYLADHLSLSVPMGLFDGKQRTLFFTKGTFTTSDEAEQKAIEETSLFATQHIRVVAPPDPRAALVAAADAAKAKAAASEKTAADAEYAAALPARLRTCAEADKKFAANAVAALADYDKANAPKDAAV